MNSKKHLLYGICLTLWLCFVPPIFAAQSPPAEGFQFSCERTIPTFSQQKRKLRGVILPHHDIAHTVFRPFFAQFSTQKTKKIILLSPNHFETGEKDILISDEFLVVDSVLRNDIHTLLQETYIELNTDAVRNDHGVTVFFPYFEAYLPQAEIIPMIFRKQMSLQQIRAFSKQLSSLIDDQTIVIASLDFAHDVVPKKAEKNDLKTKEMIETRTSASLLQLSSAFVDSPTALLTYLYMMDVQKNKTSFLWRSHAGAFLGNCSSPTTSYQIWTSVR